MTTPGTDQTTRGDRTSLSTRLLVPLFGILALLYLLNPTAGIFELLPDNLPLLGNLDEAGAMLLLANVLAWYGIDLNRFGRRLRSRTHARGADA